MIQLQALSGKMAGTQWIARHFPVRIGRAPKSDITLDEAGVWDKHAEIVHEGNAFVIRVLPPALARLNREALQDQQALRNGDLIEIGALQLRFTLAPTRHRTMRLREALTWLGLALLAGLQVYLIYLLS